MLQYVQGRNTHLTITGGPDDEETHIRHAGSQNCAHASHTEIRLQKEAKRSI